jgi:large subunit ribosomal protein L22
MQEVTAKLKFFRQGPRKVRLVADLIRGKKVTRALEILSLLNKKAARTVKKLLESAVANAKHNYSLAIEDLKITKITIDGGPSLKRWMPKAHGRATPVRERTSHINLVLTVMEKKESKAMDDAKKTKSEENKK